MHRLVHFQQQNAGYSIISKALLPVPTPGGADIPVRIAHAV